MISIFSSLSNGIKAIYEKDFQKASCYFLECLVSINFIIMLILFAVLFK